MFASPRLGACRAVQVADDVDGSGPVPVARSAPGSSDSGVAARLCGTRTLGASGELSPVPTRWRRLRLSRSLRTSGLEPRRGSSCLARRLALDTCALPLWPRLSSRGARPRRDRAPGSREAFRTLGPPQVCDAGEHSGASLPPTCITSSRPPMCAWAAPSMSGRANGASTLTRPGTTSCAHYQSPPPMRWISSDVGIHAATGRSRREASAFHRVR